MLSYLYDRAPISAVWMRCDTSRTKQILLETTTAIHAQNTQSYKATVDSSNQNVTPGWNNCDGSGIHKGHLLSWCDIKRKRKKTQGSKWLLAWASDIVVRAIETNDSIMNLVFADVHSDNKQNVSLLVLDLVNNCHFWWIE